GTREPCGHGIALAVPFLRDEHRVRPGASRRCERRVTRAAVDDDDLVFAGDLREDGADVPLLVARGDDHADAKVFAGHDPWSLSPRQRSPVSPLPPRDSEQSPQPRQRVYGRPSESPPDRKGGPALDL